MWCRFWLCSLLAVQIFSPVKSLLFEERRGTTPQIPPSRDSFYKVPPTIRKRKPGTILRHRITPSNVIAFEVQPENLQSSHQILYRTNDADGNPTATVMTVLVPKHANFSAVLSFQVAENAILIDCAPSYAITAASNVDPLFSSSTAQLQVLLMQAALEDGWVVVVPDFQGPMAAYADTKMSGHAILDGLRAAVRSGPVTGIKQGALLAIWGYSAGASATKYAAELKPKYAPELKLAGAAFGGIATASRDPFDGINKTPHAGLIPTSLIGVARRNSWFNYVLNTFLKDEFRQIFNAPLHQCLEANLDTFENKDIKAMFNCWQFCVYPSLLLAVIGYYTPTGVPEVPIFWYQSANDEIASIKDVDIMVGEYCSKGAKVHYQRDESPSGSHKNHGIVGAPEALRWLKGVMHGRRPANKCVREPVVISKLPNSFLKIFPDSIKKILIDVLNEPS